VFTGIFAIRDERLPPTSRLGNGEVAATAQAIEHRLGRNEPVRITIVSHDAWPAASGVALELERAGHRTTVADTDGIWKVLFGARRVSHGGEKADVELYLENDPAGRARAQGDPMGTVADAVILERPLG
jgi:hypothetical protein